MKLLILGAGGHGRVVKETAGLMKDKANNPLFDEISFLDDNSPEAIGRLDEYESFCGEYRFAFAAFGNNTFRLEWMDKLEKAGFSVPTLIHPMAVVSPSAVIDNGTVIEAGAIINTNCKIGRGAIISVGTIIDHDSTIGEGCHIDCGAVVKSMCNVQPYRKVQSNEIINRQ